MRFPDFNDEWTPFFVGDIAKLGRGRVISNKEIQIQLKPLYPVYSSQTLNNGVMGYLDTFDFEGEYITWTTDGANAGTVFYRSGKFNCTNVCGILKLKSEFSHLFCALGLQKETKNFVSTNLANPKLMNNTMAKISLSIPSLAEQKKIADFLSLIDERIQSCSETIKELKTQKAGLLNQLFSQKLRFPDFNDEWRVTTLGEILLEVSERNSKNINRVISSTINGLFDQKEYFNRDIASKDISNYKILKRNQLVLSPQNIWMGNINVNLSFDVGIVSPSYKIYSLDHDSIDFRFASYALKTPVMLQRYKDSSSQGASVVRRNLDIDSFYSVTLPLPTLSEQKKIADFLSLIDERIEVEEQLLQQYEKQKRYLLRQMFV